MPKLNVVRRARSAPLPLPSVPGLGGRDLLSLHDLRPDEVEYLIDLGRQVKAQPARYGHTLEGKEMALLFEKPSLRTRVTFEFAMTEAGGKCITLGPQEVGLGQREAIKDVARNLSRWVDVVTARVFSHEALKELAENATVPVINGLSDFEHPCQALGDFLTLHEYKGHLAGLTLAFVGDGNNVANSLIFGATRLGVHIRIATPPGCEPNPAVVAEAQFEGGSIYLTHDAGDAVRGADAVYTDVWTSMGQEGNAEARLELFRPYQVNAELMRQAKPGAFFMHCLPARRGQEVTDEVIDSPRSIVYDQAENRLHIEKAILVALLA
ncbi:MAG TPA: ornithine carbamoyltransferase [Terriglobia bacterium]|nr:ornithine carbamoyltransferase [Terriglobia bacterium]